MPTYVYHCDGCGENFDHLITYSQADQSPSCPHCGSTETHKQVITRASSTSSNASSGCRSDSRGGFV